MNKIGVMFCHGHRYGPSKLPRWLPRDIDWTMVDIRPENQPDVIGSYLSINTLFELGLFSYDYVLNMNCPSGDSMDNVLEILRSGRLLLKPGGSFYYPDLIYSAMSIILEIPLNENGFLPREQVKEFALNYKRGAYPEILEYLENLTEGADYQEYKLLPGGRGPFRRVDMSVEFIVSSQ
jgi:hypothetical protein